MTEMKRNLEGNHPRRSEALSPAGRMIGYADLPPPDTKRWVVRRKAEVVAGVHAGLITLEEACRRYSLTVDEFRSWERLLQKHGMDGLRITRLKKYRQASPPNAEAQAAAS